jgi:hypothetical protein
MKAFISKNIATLKSNPFSLSVTYVRELKQLNMFCLKNQWNKPRILLLAKDADKNLEKKKTNNARMSSAKMSLISQDIIILAKDLIFLQLAINVVDTLSTNALSAEEKTELVNKNGKK